MRLSPCAHRGHVAPAPSRARVPKRVDCSRIENRLRSSLRTWNTPSPPRPSSGFTIISPPSLARKSTSSRIELRDARLRHQVRRSGARRASRSRRGSRTGGSARARAGTARGSASRSRRRASTGGSLRWSTRSTSSSSDERVRVRELGVAALLAPQCDGAHTRDHAPRVDAEIARIDVEHAVPAPLRFQHQHKCRVGADVDRRDRVHHERDRERRRRTHFGKLRVRAEAVAHGERGSATVRIPPERR